MTITGLAQKFDVHAYQITQWQTQMLERAADFCEIGSSPSAPPVKIKRLYAEIGELTLVNDFLESALTKTGFITDQVYFESRPALLAA